ncbi:MAG: bifunctional 3,4-dihydroxy-2-butanone-4-phosphate synthase/GTP cyclohydrolase II [Planctomycetes bacterium]|nr:bifunctional 3,4-dihydroxy-2-butanone-4-phosphate synthase/GTP cyclohydrolase II [Planctomycetota bacterium]
MTDDNGTFCTIEEALDELRAGRMIVLVDDQYRENEGDLVIAADRVTPEAINFMLTHARGILCLSMSAPLCERMHLDPQTSVNSARMGTAFTVKFDARSGIETGTSAYDRCRSIQAAVNPHGVPADLVRPGHVDGLRAQPGGVLVRTGHTEGSVDLARLAGFQEAAVICEVLQDDGRMARVPQLREFCRRHALKMCTIENLIKYRRQREKLIRRELVVKLPTHHGEFDLIAYTSVVDPEPHLALCKGGVGVEVEGCVPVQQDPILVRIHSSCLTGDVFESKLCDCGSQLHQAMKQVAEAGKGVVLYMRQEGRGIGLLSKLRAYQLQQQEELDTVEANLRLGFAPDLRHYGIGAQILVDLGVRDIRLLTNNPKKVVGIEGYGLNIVERVPIQVPANPNNYHYLKTKKEKLGHHLDDLSPE